MFEPGLLLQRHVAPRREGIVRRRGKALAAGGGETTENFSHARVDFSTRPRRTLIGDGLKQSLTYAAASFGRASSAAQLGRYVLGMVDRSIHAWRRDKGQGEALAELTQAITSHFPPSLAAQALS